MLGTWPLTVGAVFYFLYAAGLIAALTQGFVTGDPRVSAPFATLAIVLALVATGIGLAMLRARRRRSAWLIWIVGAVASLAGLTAGFVGWIVGAVILAPMLFGMLGVSRVNDDG